VLVQLAEEALDELARSGAASKWGGAGKTLMNASYA
jgi:hypothetical protein